MRDLTRRQVMAGGGAGLAMLAGMPSFAAGIDELISSVTKGMAPGAGLVSLVTPEVAENGNSVSISVAAPGAKSISIFADRNPAPKVAAFTFGPLNPTQSASTRIRLASSQNVIALAEMSDGSWQLASSEVKVTIGGCGG